MISLSSEKHGKCSDTILFHQFTVVLLDIIDIVFYLYVLIIFPNWHVCILLFVVLMVFFFWTQVCIIGLFLGKRGKYNDITLFYCFTVVLLDRIYLEFHVYVLNNFAIIFVLPLIWFVCHAICEPSYNIWENQEAVSLNMKFYLFTIQFVLQWLKSYDLLAFLTRMLATPLIAVISIKQHCYRVMCLLCIIKFNNLLVIGYWENWFCLQWHIKWA
jgi:hypothetical protein